ncbi:MAG: hypothetical protein CL534_23315 [Ahrensia sp.]|nr:hypothetical protein [Ahrensia sp.]
MPKQPVSPQLRANAKRMRKDMTEAERRLWNQIRAHRLMGLGFRRQMPVAGHIADFACPQYRLIVEVDGTQHAEAGAIAADEKRTRKLGQTGWTVIRFWNHEVMHELDAVCDHIVAVVRELEENANG